MTIAALLLPLSLLQAQAPAFHWHDCDGDGTRDAFVVGADGSGHLLLGDGSGRLAPDERGLLPSLDGLAGARFVDLDGDGGLDLVVWGPRATRWFRAQPGGFVEATVESGLELAGGAAMLDVLDADGDGRLDLLLSSPGAEGRNAAARIARQVEGGWFEAFAVDLAGPALGGDPDAGVPAPRTPIGVDELEGGPGGGPDRTLGGNRGTVSTPRPDAIAAPPIAVPPGPGHPTGRDGAPRARAGRGAGPAIAGGGIGPFTEPGAGASPICASSVADQALGGCLAASSVATLGMLYPLSSELFVDAATGFVGMGTEAPETTLHVEAVDVGFQKNFGNGVDGITVEATDAALMLVSQGAGAAGSAISLQEWAGGAVQDNWSLYRRTLAANALLILSYGTSPNWFSNPALVTFTPAGDATFAGDVRADRLNGGSSVASGLRSVATGNQNTATDQDAAAVGGFGNTASGRQAVTLGGQANIAGGLDSAVVGGTGSWAVGDGAVVLGGSGNFAGGSRSLAAGERALAAHGRTFVWSGSSASGSNDFVSTASNQFLIGSDTVGIGTNAPEARLHVEGNDLGARTSTIAELEGLVIENDLAALTMFSSSPSASGSAIRLTAWDPIADERVETWRLQHETSGNASSALVLGYEDHLGAGTKDALVLEADGDLGLGTDAPQASLHLVEKDLGLTVNPTGARQGIVVEAGDAYLSLYSEDQGFTGSSLVLKEWDTAAGALEDVWGVYRTASSSGSTLRVSYGTNENWSSNPTFLTILPSGPVGIGTSTPGAPLEVAGNVKATAFIQTSDARLKRAVEPLEDARALVRGLRGVTYEWNRERLAGADERRHLGFLAQEVRAVLPEAVVEDADGGLAVAYAELVPVLVEALKEQDRELAELRARLEALERR